LHVAALRPRSILDWGQLRCYSDRLPVLKIQKEVAMKTSLGQEALAEFFGTMLFMTFGCGSVAMVKLFGTGVPGEIVNGGYTHIVLGWGLGVMLGVYLAGRISGAHLNPAVTLSLAIFRGFSWRKVMPYILAQMAGAFLAAALVFWNYLPAFHRADPNLALTGSIFTTFPAFPGRPMVGLLDQVIGTALLLITVFAVTDERNQAPSQTLQPVLIGLIVVLIGISFGALQGYAINPARDLGPRVFITLAGFKYNGLIDGTGVFWVPIVGPMIGGPLGAFAYEHGIRRWLPKF
jgi:glycerol uptake facilitator protein